MRPITLILALILGSASLAQSQTTTILNLTSSTIDGHEVSNLGVFGANSENVVGGWLGGSFFRRAVPSDYVSSGSGGFRDLYRIQDTSTAVEPENGYNRNIFSDVSIPGGFDPIITVSDLVENVEAGFYCFAFDTHESTGGNSRYISLDDARIYVGGTSDPTSLPGTVSELSSLGTKVYAMNGVGEQNHVLLDSSLFAGSGQMDFFMFVPTSMFAGFSPDSLVYFYTSWGQYSYMGAGRTSGFESSATPEDVALGAVSPQVLAPEPGTCILLLSAGICAVFTRRRNSI